MLTQPARQLALFTAERLPHRPYCIDEYGAGKKWRIRAVDQALRYAHIQPNAPTVIFRMIFDIDRPGAAFAFEFKNLPPPNWAATNPVNGHAHVSYELAIPVNLLDKSTKAAKLLVALESAIGRRLGADPAFSGAICKNPINREWGVLEFSTRAYSLSELSEWVDHELHSRPPLKKGISTDADCYAIGRNFTMFELLRQWAYVAVRDYWRPGTAAQDAWIDAVRAQIEVIWGRDQTNWATDNHAYLVAERTATAKSVARWVWTNMTPTSLRKLIEATHTPELQAERGRASGEARRAASSEKRDQARQLAADGMTHTGIAAALGVPRSTVIRWTKA